MIKKKNRTSPSSSSSSSLYQIVSNLRATVKILLSSSSRYLRIASLIIKKSFLSNPYLGIFQYLGFCFFSRFVKNGIYESEYKSINVRFVTSGVEIPSNWRGASPLLSPEENQRPRWRRHSHPRDRHLQMGTLGFTWYLNFFFYLDSRFILLLESKL